MEVPARSLHLHAVIETPEQLELKLSLAGPGTRSVALLIDSFCQLAFVVACFFLPWRPVLDWIQERLGNLFTDKSDRVMAFLAGLALLTFVVNFFYFAAFEMLWRGQTPGKRAMGLRVVRDGGYPLDARSALLRNLLRGVDFLPGSYFLGAGVLFAYGTGKRIGDYVAGTIVISENAAGGEVVHSPHASSPWIQAPSTGLRLTDAQSRLLNEFLQRRDTMQPEARKRLATMISVQLATQLGKVVQGDPEEFLEECRSHAGH